MIVTPCWVYMRRCRLRSVPSRPEAPATGKTQECATPNLSSGLLPRPRPAGQGDRAGVV